MLFHKRRVDPEDLPSALLIGQTDLHLDFQSTGSQQSLVNHIPPVGHTDDQDVVQLLHAVNFGQQLIHHCVMHSSTPVNMVNIIFIQLF